MPQPLRFDRTLYRTVIGLTLFGLMMIFSVTTADAEPSYRYIIKQTTAVAIGLAAMRFLMFRNYRDWRNQKIVFLALGGVIVLLVAAVMIGVGANTSRFLRVGWLSIQPSEFAKPALILFLAFYIDGRENKLNDWRGLGGCALILAALCALVLAGKDLGTTVLMGLIAGVVLWIAGMRTAVALAGAGLIVVLAGGAVLAAPYRIKRVTGFLHAEADPQGAGYQLLQSEIAVGSGGLTGQGVMLGRQKMRFLPAAHTDFIFAVVAEELGFLGAAALVCAFGVILWRGLRAAWRAPDAFGSYLAAGMTAMLVFQAMINLGVVLALLPTTGMPLPFVSYGGSAMITCLAAAGLLLNVSQHAE